MRLADECRGGVFPARPTGTDGLRHTWPRPGERAWCNGWTSYRLRIIRIVLTVAHINHDPTDNCPENLKALCQRCHNRLDAQHRAAGRKARARAARAIGELV